MTDEPRRIRFGPSPTNPSGKWLPIQGEAFTKLLNKNNHLSDQEREKLIEETFSILKQCSPPCVNNSVNTGLVVGYIQSGKTLSFTGVTALARDNKYPLVILLAGTTNNLVQQSYERLKKDLDVEDTREWNVFSTKDNHFQENEAERVQSELKKWHEKNPRARTIVIVMMKQHQHLEALTKLLLRCDFSDVPVLIIDDEGDQASMNTKAKQSKESTTYAKIKQFRKLFPHHSYLLYTATPQAPLLISRIDTLSPDFGCVLTPGKNYVGGQEFFVEGVNNYVRHIPESELQNEDRISEAPPNSFKDALCDFLVGVAIGLLEGEFEKNQNRSMMIHPAVTTDDHLMFARWTRTLKGHWSTILRDPNHYDYEELIETFRKTAEKLLKTYPTKFTFDEIVSPSCLLEAIETTSIKEFNTREQNRIDTINWQGEYSWILIGGIGLDRGFTVEGLTVSYMPRSLGVGNADNLQQRARFFGYKEDYLGLCRIYLPAESIDAFAEYVKHEEAIRSSIKKNLEKGNTLKDWRRNYLLDPSLKPTRSSVILLKMYPFQSRNGWVVPDYPFEDINIIDENHKIIVDIFDSLSNYFQSYDQDGWNENQRIPKFSD